MSRAKWLLVGVIGLMWSVGATSPAQAAARLEVAPLEYRTSLKVGEKKKGFVDVSNPDSTTVRVKTSVQAFRQTDDRGSLEFYDDERMKSGVKLDLTEFDLGPKQAIRMYFLLDGTALRSGDVFGAIFFSLKPKTASPQSASLATIRVGTLLSLVNGTPSSRQAEVTRLDASSLQFDDTIRGTFSVKNTGDPKKTTGFYPEVKVAVWPFGETRTLSSKLVFAGRTRSSEFTAKAPPVGVYRVSVSHGDSSQSRWVVVIQPYVLLILGVIVLGLLILTKYRRRQRRIRLTSS
ncbi:MAG TPA: hypothetical protein VF597_00915 [Candidatus Saccharimonadales bacterium]|jgi:hypothetical protein